MVRPRGRREAPGETLDDAEGVIQTVVADREFAECYTGLVRTVMQFSLVAVMQWSVGEWLSLVEHLVRDTTEQRDLKSKSLIRRCFCTEIPGGNLLRLVPSLSPNSPLHLVDPSNQQK